MNQPTFPRLLIPSNLTPSPEDKRQWTREGKGTATEPLSASPAHLLTREGMRDGGGSPGMDDDDT